MRLASSLVASALVALVALVAPAASAQLSALRAKTCDTRIDVNTLPRQGNALHYIRFPGSYIVTGTIHCAAGQTAIAIDPLASSVVIEFNGYEISGDAALTAVSAVSCPPAPVERELLVLRGVVARRFGGPLLAIDSVRALRIEGADLADGGTTGITATVGSCDAREINQRNLPTATVLNTYGRTSLTDVEVSYCGPGLVLRSPQCVVRRATISDCSGDGVDFEPPAGGPGGSSTAFFSMIDSLVSYCDDGLSLSSGGRWIEVDAQVNRIFSCTGDGVAIELSGSVPAGGQDAHTLRLGSLQVEDSGGDGIRITQIGGGPDTPAVIDLQDISCDLSATRGIAVDCRRPLVVADDVRCTSNGGHGFELQASSRGQLQARGLSLLDNGGSGLRLDSSSPLPGGGALAVELSDLTSSSNALDGCEVSSSGGGSLMLRGFALDDNGRNGLQCSGLHLKSYDGKTFRSGQHGVQLTGGSGYVLRVTARDCVGNGLHVQGASLTCKDTVLSHNATNLYCSDGRVDLEGCVVQYAVYRGQETLRTPATLQGCTLSDNGSDGLLAGAQVVGYPPQPLVLRDCTLARNGGFGLQATDSTALDISRSSFANNALGGLVSGTGGTCSAGPCRVVSSSFDSNGVTAALFRDVRDGSIDGCDVSNSPTGIYVGDPLGGSCARGMTITDNAVAHCDVGYHIAANGKHVVVRNTATECNVAPFVLGAGNTCGPVLSSSADLVTTPNPFANLAP